MNSLQLRFYALVLRNLIDVSAALRGSIGSDLRDETKAMITEIDERIKADAAFDAVKAKHDREYSEAAMRSLDEMLKPRRRWWQRDKA